jgi:hypothetical protein
MQFFLLFFPYFIKKNNADLIFICHNDIPVFDLICIAIFFC